MLGVSVEPSLLCASHSMLMQSSVRKLLLSNSKFVQNEWKFLPEQLSDAASKAWKVGNLKVESDCLCMKA